jgi:hypothetical protein
MYKNDDDDDDDNTEFGDLTEEYTYNPTISVKDKNL